MQNLFSYERFRTWTRFETEAQENSEMAYSVALSRFNAGTNHENEIILNTKLHSVMTSFSSFLSQVWLNIATMFVYFVSNALTARATVELRKTALWKKIFIYKRKTNSAVKSFDRVPSTDEVGNYSTNSRMIKRFTWFTARKTGSRSGQCFLRGPSHMVSGTRDNPPPEATLTNVYMWKRRLCRPGQSGTLWLFITLIE